MCNGDNIHLTPYNGMHVPVIVSFHKPSTNEANYNITILMPVNMHVCLDPADSNANDDVVSHGN